MLRLFMLLAASFALRLPFSVASPLRGCAHAPDPHHPNATYDYIIVGGGLSGFVLANQLSQNCQTIVLLLEAGPDTSNVQDIYILGFAGLNEFSPQAWSYYVVPQKSLDGATPHLAQGFWGAKSVFDQWAQMSGNEALAWKNLLHDFEATTALERDAIAPNYTGQVINSTVYGDGPLSLTRALTLDGFDQYWNEAMQSVLDLPEVDFKDVSRRRAYAYPALGNPLIEREHVRLENGAYATGIKFSGLRATSVNYTDTKGGNTTYTVRANEIILSAGAISSPKLLMLSDIGPRAHLQNLSISILLDSPAVGSNLYDHNYASIKIEVADSVYTLSEWQNASYLSNIKQQWYNQHDGPLANAPASSFAILRVPVSAIPGPNGSFHRSLPADRGQLQFQYANVALIAGTAPATEKVTTPWEALTQPEASGWVRLASADPMAHPLTNTAYFGSAGDMECVLWGYKRFRDVLASPLLKPIIVREIYPGVNVTSDADLIKAI